MHFHRPFDLQEQGAIEGCLKSTLSLSYSTLNPKSLLKDLPVIGPRFIHELPKTNTEIFLYCMAWLVECLANATYDAALAKYLVSHKLDVFNSHQEKAELDSAIIKYLSVWIFLCLCYYVPLPALTRLCP